MIRTTKHTRDSITISWEPIAGARSYVVYWADRNFESMVFRRMGEIPAEDECDGILSYTLHKAATIPHYFKVMPVTGGEERQVWEIYETPVWKIKREQIENLDRGLIAVRTESGIFLSWRLLLSEVWGYDEKKRGLTGVDFHVYRSGTWIATVSDSTNYLDRFDESLDVQLEYQVAAVCDGMVRELCRPARPMRNNYLDIPIKKPEDGVTPAGEVYTYSANDMSVADVDGDGEYEYIVKWDPSNSHDVSIKGYTGNCFIDCYKLNGTLLWRLDMGPNIRAGAHYTQFICCDFNGDGQAEMNVKTAPGTCMTRYHKDGTILSQSFITMPPEDIECGYSHTDYYVCSSENYYHHMMDCFSGWKSHPLVMSGNWPQTVEECFGLKPRYLYPLSEQDAKAVTDYFMDVYAPSRSNRNRLREFEGFIYEGPEYLTVFAGDGRELETIPFKFGREDDGLMWGDYAMKRIEPCNRVDRFLSGVAYLDGMRPYLIVCRGYYSRSTLVAYDFFHNHFSEYWSVDSGFVPMNNPFNDNHPHEENGTDPVFGTLAGQGNHSLAAADVDGDGCMEIIYGAACIDHDGALLYSSSDSMPDGRIAKLGHGDAMHVARIDPDTPGFSIFNVFEGATAAPYGYALRDGESGKVIFGKYAESDLGRCMVGDIVPGVRGLQCWVNDVAVYDCHGKNMNIETPGTNMSIRWAADLSTQVTDGVNYLNQQASGVINDISHGIMLFPQSTLTNNGTKGNPCLVADVFGDFREEILLRTEDSSAIRIYTNTEITNHKLFTLMQDSHYRCGVAWQNNCYNQPGYPDFYYASDMSFQYVLPNMSRKPVIYLAGDSTMQAYGADKRPQSGWGEYLLSELEEGNAVHTYHREDSPSSQQLCYESKNLIVDNCAMAGRSSKTFREEGRLADILERIREGDYLVIQFGHNDCAADKPERYVPVEKFKESLEYYIAGAMEKNAIPILVSSIALRPCMNTAAGKLLKIAEALPEYAKVMKDISEERGLIYIDMGTMTAEHCNIHPNETGNWYKEDDVHLVETGAKLYAWLFAEHFRRLLSW